MTLGDPKSKDNKLVVENYNFGLVEEQQVFSGSFDAIIGLAYPKMAEVGVTPFFDNLINEDVLEKNIFAFYMSTNKVDASELMFGAWDDSKIV